MTYLISIVVACLVIATVHDLLKRDDVDYRGLIKQHWRIAAFVLLVGFAIWCAMIKK